MRPRPRVRMEPVDILVGAAAIEIAVLARLHAKGLAVSLDDLEWNRGRGLLQTPEYLVLRIKSVDAPVVMRVFRRRDLADAAHTITWHVRHQIEQLVHQCIRPINPSAGMPRLPQTPDGGSAQDHSAACVAPEAESRVGGFEHAAG
jgi:hypothetical protein